MDQLTFAWESISTNLSAAGVHYFVSASNCVCPNTTNTNSVRCDFISTSNLILRCSLVIQTVVCDRIGSASEPFVVTIKSTICAWQCAHNSIIIYNFNVIVPGPPRVQIMQVTEDFALIKAAFNKTVRFS